MADDALLEFVAQIVSAHVSHNLVQSVDLPKLITDVHRAWPLQGNRQCPREASLPSPSASP
jgi:predicted transcriptional regulator